MRILKLYRLLTRDRTRESRSALCRSDSRLWHVEHRREGRSKLSSARASARDKLPIAPSVYCRWRKPDGKLYDESRVGPRTSACTVVSIAADSSPVRGSSIEATVSFPLGTSRPATRVQMKGKATVVRVEPGCFAIQPSSASAGRTIRR